MTGSIALGALLTALVGWAYKKRPIALGIWLALLFIIFILFGGTASIVLGLILLCLLLGQPLFVLMGMLSVVTLIIVTGGREGADLMIELEIIVDKILELASKEVLLAIPFFVVAGEIMTQGSLAKRLIDVAKALFGWMPGGLAVAGVAGCIFFAAISGSSPVTVIAIGSIMVPALIKAGYPERFAIGLFTTAGSLGILIPPSIPMIVYSIMVGATTPMDPKDLFLAGIVPGAMIGGMLALWSISVGLRNKLPTQPFSLPHIINECKRGFWSLLLPLIILGGIYTGIFTATEAAAVSVVYALVVEVFIHGELKLKDLVGVAESSMTVMGALFLIIALAIGLNHVLVLEQVPDRMVVWMQSLELNRVTFLLIVNIFLLIVGCFMDIMSAILILAPMLAPMSMAMGIDPIHMGIIFIVNLEIGYCTPPVGLNLFVSSTLFKKGLGDIIAAVLRPLAIMAVGLLLLTWIPPLSTGLGRLLEGRPIWDDDPVEQTAEPTPEPEAAPDDAPPDGVLSLQEMMAQAAAKADGGSAEDDGAGGGEVKSLQELMQEAAANAEADDEQAGDAPPSGGKVKSLQELMQEAAGNAEAETDDADEAEAPAEPGRVKSLQELMQEAASEDAEGDSP
jgi:C4-dicarboxylate transporter DctM subunit